MHIHMGVVNVASPHAECMRNGKHLSIMDRVVHLCRVELARLESFGLEAVALILHEDSTDGKVRCISVKPIGKEGVEED